MTRLELLQILRENLADLPEEQRKDEIRHIMHDVENTDWEKAREARESKDNA